MIRPKPTTLHQYNVGLTVGALLAAGLQQELGDGGVVGHDGDVQGGQALAVGGVEVQLVGRVLVQQDLHSVQVLLLHRLQDAVAALHSLGGVDKEAS